VPQESIPPQPSETVPQSSPAGHVVIGVQPHTPEAPQVTGGVHVPPAQQGCPCAPHATQPPPAHTPPSMHAMPLPTGI
jgi:hypothetical protein